MKLYHATRATRTDTALEIAETIEAESFNGGNVWDYEDVVFLASRPLTGFGGWSDAWVVVDVPEAVLAQGDYAEKYWDDDQYGAKCFCFKSGIINRYRRYATDEKEDEEPLTEQDVE